MELAHGLSDHEIRRIEKSFRFTFSPEHRELLITALPSGESWPDWRDGSHQDLQARLDWPVDGVLFDVHNNWLLASIVG